MRSQQTNTKSPAVKVPPFHNESVFRRDGECWTLAFNGFAIGVRDAKGLRHLAYLLERPGVAVSAVALLDTPKEHKFGGGRSQPSGRVAGSAGAKPDRERARLVVTKRIHAAIQRIASLHPPLAYHLSVTVKTGALCMYRPDPQRPIAWNA